MHQRARRRLGAPIPGVLRPQTPLQGVRRRKGRRQQRVLLAERAGRHRKHGREVPERFDDRGCHSRVDRWIVERGESHGAWPGQVRRSPGRGSQARTVATESCGSCPNRLHRRLVDDIMVVCMKGRRLRPGSEARRLSKRRSLAWKLTSGAGRRSALGAALERRASLGCGATAELRARSGRRPRWKRRANSSESSVFKIELECFWFKWRIVHFLLLSGAGQWSAMPERPVQCLSAYALRSTQN